MTQQLFDVKRTFINFTDGEMNCEHPSDTVSRKRSSTWDGSMNREPSLGSTDCVSDEDEAGARSTAASSASEDAKNSNPNGTENGALVQLAFHDGTQKDTLLQTLQPCGMPPGGCVPVGQWSPNEHGQMTFYCMGFVPMPAAEGAASDPMAMAAEMRARAAELRVAAREAKRQSQAAQKATTVSYSKEIVNVAGSVSSGGRVETVVEGGINSAVAEHDRTTIMLRNLPNDYMRDTVCELLDAQGFSGCYSFVYVPVDFQRWSGFGYAFVNMVTNRDALRMHAIFQGFKEWKVGSVKVCDVSWGEPLQGLEAHIERYRNSPVMHYLVPDSFKPGVFHRGQRAEFPLPTKRLRPPRDKCGQLRRIEDFKISSSSRRGMH